MNSQGDNSSSLKAGNTKVRSGAKAGVTNNMRYAPANPARKDFVGSRDQPVAPRLPSPKWIQTLL